MDKSRAKRVGASIIIFFIIIGLLFFSLCRTVRSQTLSNKIGINTEYAFPTQDTPVGVEVNSAALVENANFWNGRIVTFTGEAIGERMVRGKMAWIHLNDDAYMGKNIEEGAALGGYNSGQAIRIPANLAQKILFFGDYKHAGDIVKVTGTFNAVCRDHGGDMDIHASSLEVLRTGHPVSRMLNIFRVILGVLLFIVAGAFYGFRRIALRR
jgi:hypothetical protein